MLFQVVLVIGFLFYGNDMIMENKKYVKDVDGG